MKLRARRLGLTLALAAASVLAVPAATAAAGELTLHPSGFGAHSYAAWKAKEGQPDSSGNKDQALYFQKQTLTTTVAAGIAEIKGIAGLPSEDLLGLAWDHREDGHCGAGAPRWNVFFQPPVGPEQVLFLGCNAATHSDAPPPASGHDWCRDTQPSPASLIPAGSTITRLQIVFDEGNDTPNPPPAGCDQEQLTGGFVHLDNITVQTSQGTKVWTSATDNGNR